MPNPIVELMEQELAWFEQERTKDQQRDQSSRLFPAIENLYPIPFFGDIRRADVLTMALNPSCTEFAQDRGWPVGLDARALTTRLLHYFDLPEPGPHKWFNNLAPAGFLISRSYRQGMAHVDLMSAATLRPRDMQGEQGMLQRQQFGDLVNMAASKLQRVLDLACMAKVILVLDYSVGTGNGGNWSVWEQAIGRIPMFQKHASGNGESAPILRASSPEGLVNKVAGRRDEIREHLANGPRLCHANYG